MATTTLTSSVCSLSWIDGRTGLPEDDGAGPPATLNGSQVTRTDDALPFRFLNLVEATVWVMESTPPRIIYSEWTSDSGIYRNPSFLGFDSEAFNTKRSKVPGQDKAVFEQTVGARTVTPERFAELVGTAVSPLFGGKIARAVAHGVKGFPPIWTTVRLTMYADGRSEHSLVCHSLFPSVTFYASPTRRGKLPRGMTTYKRVATPYNAVPMLETWKTDGWGACASSGRGPCSGNPWGYRKDDLAIRPTSGATRTV